MNNQQPPQQESTEEIDLGQLFKMIRNGFGNIFKVLLRVFLYLKRSSLKIIGLGALGVALGFGINQFKETSLKTEVIVKPNFDSKDYLYNTIDEIDANINTKDSVFFNKLNIDLAHLDGFKVLVEPIEEEKNTDDSDDLEYLELLQNFKDESFVLEILKTEMSKKTAINHRISFHYNNPVTGREITNKLLKYINSNSYFKKVSEVHRQNTLTRIEKNNVLTLQIDDLIANYSKGLNQKKNELGDGRVYLEGENGLNVTGLLGLKNRLVEETEKKRMELVQTKDVINIINLGNSQIVKKPFLGRNIILIPLTLIGLFFVFSGVKYLNKKANELQD